MHTAFITHPDCLLHDMGHDHPECPDRLKAIEDQLIASGLINYLQHCDAPLAKREHLERVHPRSHIDALQNLSPAEGFAHVDPDTWMNPYTYQAALRAAGAVVLATEMVIDGKAENAFCSIRPPGHHAERTQAMGFCFFNNVAVGVMHALEHYGLKRVAVVDFDVHHGNGTEDVFKEEPRVMLCSSFQHPFYPYFDEVVSNEHVINVPLSAGADGQKFREAVTAQWLPALDRFQPEMIFVSAGFDAHREDDMAYLRLVEADYIWVTQEIKRIAAKYCGNRIVSVLEGGYNLSALARSVVAHIKTLADL